jgi:hypothetical protein
MPFNNYYSPDERQQNSDPYNGMKGSQTSSSLRNAAIQQRPQGGGGNDPYSGILQHVQNYYNGMPTGRGPAQPPIQNPMPWVPGPGGQRGIYGPPSGRTGIPAPVPGPPRNISGVPPQQAPAPAPPSGGGLEPTDPRGYMGSLIEMLGGGGLVPSVGGYTGPMTPKPLGPNQYPGNPVTNDPGGMQSIDKGRSAIPPPSGGTPYDNYVVGGGPYNPAAGNLQYGGGPYTGPFPAPGSNPYGPPLTEGGVAPFPVPPSGIGPTNPYSGPRPIQQGQGGLQSIDKRDRGATPQGPGVPVNSGFTPPDESTVPNINGQNPLLYYALPEQFRPKEPAAPPPTPNAPPPAAPPPTAPNPRTMGAYNPSGQQTPNTYTGPMTTLGDQGRTLPPSQYNTPGRTPGAPPVAPTVPNTPPPAGGGGEDIPGGINRPDRDFESINRSAPLGGGQNPVQQDPSGLQYINKERNRGAQPGGPGTPMPDFGAWSRDIGADIGAKEWDAYQQWMAQNPNARNFATFDDGFQGVDFVDWLSGAMGIQNTGTGRRGANTYEEFMRTVQGPPGGNPKPPDDITGGGSYANPRSRADNPYLPPVPNPNQQQPKAGGNGAYGTPQTTNYLTDMQDRARELYSRQYGDAMTNARHQLALSGGNSVYGGGEGEILSDFGQGLESQFANQLSQAMFSQYGDERNRGLQWDLGNLSADTARYGADRGVDAASAGASGARAAADASLQAARLQYDLGLAENQTRRDLGFGGMDIDMARLGLEGQNSYYNNLWRFLFGGNTSPDAAWTNQPTPFPSIFVNP